MSEEVQEILKSGERTYARGDYTAAVLTFDSGIEGMFRRYLFTRYGETIGYDWRRAGDKMSSKKIRLPRKLNELMDEFAKLRWASKRGPKYHWTSSFSEADAKKYGELAKKVYAATKNYLQKLPPI